MSGDSPGGADITVEALTERLKREAHRAAGFGKAVKLDFGDDGIVRLDARSDPPGVSNEDGPADTVVRVSLANFARIVSGDLDPARAALTGRLRISGDMGAAMQMAKLFRDAR